MSQRIYTDEHINYLGKIAPGRYATEITEMFNAKFGTHKTVSAIRTLKSKNGIRSEVPRQKRVYTDEQINYLRELGKRNLFNKEITERFNKKFGTNKSESAIQNIRSKYSAPTSARNRWGKGHKPWNKGKKGYMGPNKTSFKKGSIPPNWVPIGTERLTSDGYLETKIQEGQKQKNWLSSHTLVWEAANGPVPDGHVLIFGDGDRSNLALQNLVLVSRAQLVKMNQHGLIKDNADLTKTGALIADIYNQIGKAKRRRLS